MIKFKNKGQKQKIASFFKGSGDRAASFIKKKWRYSGASFIKKKRRYSGAYFIKKKRRYSAADNVSFFCKERIRTRERFVLLQKNAERFVFFLNIYIYTVDIYRYIQIYRYL